MINNHDVLKVITVKHFTHEHYLSRNVLHDGYFEEHIMPLDYLFKWHYTNECRSIVGIKYINERR